MLETVAFGFGIFVLMLIVLGGALYYALDEVAGLEYRSGHEFDYEVPEDE